VLIDNIRIGTVWVDTEFPPRERAARGDEGSDGSCRGNLQSWGALRRRAAQHRDRSRHRGAAQHVLCV